MKVLKLAYVVLTIFLVCNWQEGFASDGEKICVVSIAPLGEFVENITQNRVRLYVMVPNVADPHTYEPVPSQMQALSKADMYVKTGSGIEFELLWMKKFIALNKEMLVCDSGAGIKRRNAYNRSSKTIKGKHHGNVKDPHIWLSPANAIIMVNNIRNALIKVDPGNAKFYSVNAKKYVVKLIKLDRKITRVFLKTKRKTFMVFHSAWGYFADDYGLREIPIKTGTIEITAVQLIDRIKTAGKHKLNTIFISPQFSKKSAEVIAHEINGKIVLVDPFAGNYVDSLKDVAQKIYRSLI